MRTETQALVIISDGKTGLERDIGMPKSRSLSARLDQNSFHCLTGLPPSQAGKPRSSAPEQGGLWASQWGELCAKDHCQAHLRLGMLGFLF